MSVISQVNSLAASIFPSATVMLASKFRASRDTFDLAAIDYPLIFIDNETNKNVSIQKNNNILKDERVLVSFLDRIDVFSQDSAILTKQDTLELMADQLMANVYQQTNIRNKANQSYTILPVFNTFVTGLCGVLLTITFTNNITIDFINKYTTPLPQPPPTP